MILSIARTINQIDAVERRVQSVVATYLDALDQVEVHLAPLTAEYAARHVANLKQIREAVDGGSIDRLRATRDAVRREMQDLAGSLVQLRHNAEAELKGVLLSIGQASDSIAAESHACQSAFQGFAQEMQKVARMDSLSSIRSLVSRSVANLKAALDSSMRENEAVLRTIKEQVQAIDDRRRHAEEAAYLDPLTSLSNRRKAELVMRSLHTLETPFAVLLCDINSFKEINDNFGHAAGDEVLRKWAGILRSHFRPSDTVARWGGDEFLVIMTSTEAEAMNRRKELEAVMGRHFVVAGVEVHTVELRAAIGMARTRGGERVEDVLARADADMYAQKPQTRLPLRAMTPAPSAG